MNCEQYLSVLATVSIDELREPHLRHHAEGCPSCGRVTEMVTERERHLVAAFDSVYPRTPAAAIAHAALATPRHPRIDWTYTTTLAMALAATAWVTVVMLTSRGSPEPASAEPVAEEVFTIRCLSAVQAGALVRQAVGRTGTVYYAGEPPRAVLTVRATKPQIEHVRSILDRYEGAEHARCSSP